VDTSGGLLGIATSAAIRGLGVIIPASIAWKAAATVLEHGQITRGYLGVAGQAVVLPENQRAAGPSAEFGDDVKTAVLVAGVTEGSPAAAAGVMVGDVLLAVNGQAIASPEDLLDVLYHAEIGKAAVLRVLRGGAAIDVTVTVGERPGR
jgi:S1-C subfamily serine protease